MTLQQGLLSLEILKFIDRIKLIEENSVDMKVGAGKIVALFMFMVAMGSMVEHGMGQGCGSTFFSSLVQLMPCRPAVTPFSPLPPSDACCNAVKMLGQSCLCVIVNGPPISGVDRNMAMQLPAKCAANFEACDLRV